MEYNEFLEKVQKKRTSKKAKIRNSWGVYDAYKLIRRNHWYNIGKVVSQHDFYSIIRMVNNMLASEFLKGNDINFPHGMGVLEMRKTERGVSFKDGRLVNTYPVNWGSTMRLWFEDDEARRNKILVRNDTKFVYKIFYNRFKATYKNQIFYEFAPNRFLKVALKDSINKGKIDTLW